jgi:glycerol-3-phosphate acyltransferase PlsY
MNEALAVVLAYLLGAIPSGYLAGRLRGIDIREVGSRNVGATNVFRSLGKTIGVAVMLADIGKGIAAVAIAAAITDDPWPLVAAGAAIVGHVFPFWLGFRGGKGVAVGAGAAVALAPLAVLVLVPVWVGVIAVTRYVSLGSIICATIGLMPLAAAVMIPCWIAVVAITRYVSVASIAAAIFLTPVAWLLGASWPTLVFAGLVSLAVLWRHRTNLARLRRGTELRLDFRRARKA